MSLKALWPGVRNSIRSVSLPGWQGGERSFVAGERMHTENSYKWQVDDFAALLQQAGFSRLRHWTDENEWFAVFLGFAGS